MNMACLIRQNWLVENELLKFWNMPCDLNEDELREYLHQFILAYANEIKKLELEKEILLVVHHDTFICDQNIHSKLITIQSKISALMNRLYMVVNIANEYEKMWNQCDCGSQDIPLTPQMLVVQMSDDCEKS